METDRTHGVIPTRAKGGNISILVTILHTNHRHVLTKYNIKVYLSFKESDVLPLHILFLRQIHPEIFSIV